MNRSPSAPILITGPTASGKSALAISLAERYGGVVINADSMQVYRELSILTARPTLEDLSRAPHRLFGHVAAADSYSVARWLIDVEAAMASARADRLRPIIVGGTGLYFKALTEGLSPLPAIPADIRAYWRRRAEDVEAAVLHAELRQRDAPMAERLHPADRQRVTRALEVIDATGRSLSEWQRQSAPPLIGMTDCVGLVVMPPREVVRRRCDTRFDLMMAAGALEEVAALGRLGLDLSLPAMRAIGVRPLLSHLQGNLSIEAAVEAGKAETRQYVKRQSTWISSNNASWSLLELEETCDLLRQSIQLIDGA